MPRKPPLSPTSMPLETPRRYGSCSIPDPLLPTLATYPGQALGKHMTGETEALGQVPDAIRLAFWEELGISLCSLERSSLPWRAGGNGLQMA